MPENLGDDALRTVLLVAVIQDLHDDLVAVHRMQIPALRNVDIPEDVLVVRHDEAGGFALMIKADQLLHTMLKDLRNMSLGAM